MIVDELIEQADGIHIRNLSDEGLKTMTAYNLVPEEVKKEKENLELLIEGNKGGFFASKAKKRGRGEP